MEASINAKVEKFINTYMDGGMDQKEFIMEAIEEELRNEWSQTSESIGLTYEEENYIMFSSLALPVRPKYKLRFLMNEMRACLDKRELTKNDIRKFHYIFNQIDFDKVRKSSLSEDTLWGAVDRCELAICDALTLAKAHCYDDAMDFINFALLCMNELGSLVWDDFACWESKA